MGLPKVKKSVFIVATDDSDLVAEVELAEDNFKDAIDEAKQGALDHHEDMEIYEVRLVAKVKFVTSHPATEVLILHRPSAL